MDLFLVFLLAATSLSKYLRCRLDCFMCGTASYYTFTAFLTFFTCGHLISILGLELPKKFLSHFEERACMRPGLVFHQNACGEPSHECPVTLIEQPERLSLFDFK